MGTPFDLYSNIKVENALDVTSISSDTNTDGEIIDVEDFRGITFLLRSGTITDGAYTVTLRHGDDSGLSDAADVSSDDVLGSISFADTDDNTVKRIGYIGKKRYVQMRVVSTGTTSGGSFNGNVIKSVPNSAPVANQ